MKWITFSIAILFCYSFEPFEVAGNGAHAAENIRSFTELDFSFLPPLSSSINLKNTTIDKKDLVGDKGKIDTGGLNSTEKLKKDIIHNEQSADILSQYKSASRDGGVSSMTALDQTNLIKTAINIALTKNINNDNNETQGAANSQADLSGDSTKPNIQTDIKDSKSQDPRTQLDVSSTEHQEHQAISPVENSIAEKNPKDANNETIDTKSSEITPGQSTDLSTTTTQRRDVAAPKGNPSAQVDKMPPPQPQDVKRDTNSTTTTVKSTIKSPVTKQSEPRRTNKVLETLVKTKISETNTATGKATKDKKTKKDKSESIHQKTHKPMLIHKAGKDRAGSNVAINTIGTMVPTNTGQDIDPNLEEVEEGDLPEIANRPVYDYQRTTLSPNINKDQYGENNQHLPKRFYKDEYSALLFVAAVQEDIGAMKALLEKGADINATDTRNGYTPLMYATRENKPQSVRYLLVRGAHYNARAMNGKTALHIAAIKGYLDIMRALLSVGADPLIADSTERRAFDYIDDVDNSMADLVKSYSDMNKALVDGVVMNSPSTIKYALDHGANVFQVDPSGTNVLITAIKARNLNALAALLAYGADPNSLDANGKSALAIAQELQYQDIANILRTVLLQRDLERAQALTSAPIEIEHVKNPIHGHRLGMERTTNGRRPSPDPVVQYKIKSAKSLKR